MFGHTATIPIDIDINKKEPMKILEEFVNIFCNDIVLRGTTRRSKLKDLNL